MKRRKIIIFTIIIVILFLITVIGLFFYFFWQGGPEIRKLNKNLPQGIRIEKRKNQQVIVNKKDGYEIKVPKEWGGLKSLDYVGEEEGQLSIGAKKTNDRAVIISSKNNDSLDLLFWVKKRFKTMQGIHFYNPYIVSKTEKIGNYQVIKVKDESPYNIFYFYYFKNKNIIYEIYSDYSEKSIEEIIMNGKF